MHLQLSGDITLLARFHELPPKVQKKYGRRGVAKAARLMVKSAKTKCTVRTGQLKKSLGFRPRTYKTGVFAVIGPRGGFETVGKDGKKHDPKKIAHLVEMGHGGPRPAMPKPFLRPAMYETAPECANKIAAELAAGLRAEVKP
jgi:HK97 gp10 family phage protein